MRRQRNKTQMKEQIKTPELNEMEISNLSDAEFKTLVIRMLKELSEELNSLKNRTEEHTNSNKEQFTGKQQRMDEANNQINVLEHKEAKNNHAKQEKKN